MTTATLEPALPMSSSTSPGNEDYLPRRLHPHPPPPKNRTTSTMISIMSHVSI